jgi:hypothetical protein
MRLKLTPGCPNCQQLRRRTDPEIKAELVQEAFDDGAREAAQPMTSAFDRGEEVVRKLFLKNDMLPALLRARMEGRLAGSRAFAERPKTDVELHEEIEEKEMSDAVTAVLTRKLGEEKARKVARNPSKMKIIFTLCKAFSVEPEWKVRDHSRAERILAMVAKLTADGVPPRKIAALAAGKEGITATWVRQILKQQQLKKRK